MYRTVEHAFQASKCWHHIDQLRIRMCPTPQNAKTLGRQILIKPEWDFFKMDTMEQLVRNKFKNSRLRTMLRFTEKRPLIEENTWHDTFWGICICAEHDGDGENHLGRILMKVRDEIFAEQ